MINPSRRTLNYKYAIRNLARSAAILERAGREIIYLNIGDPQKYGFRPPEHLVEAVTRALRNGFTGYSESAGLREAREAVAAYATTTAATPTNVEEVLITAGASEAGDLVLTALLNNCDEVLLPSPGYPLYPAIVNRSGGEVRYYTLDSSNKWQPSVEEVKRLITKRTRALVLINPNNPTGSITSDSVTRQLLELAVENQLLVISDEVYRELCFGPQPTPASVFARELGLPLVTLESLSKTHLVPGWRVGWMRFTNSEQMTDLITAINRLADGRLCSPTPAQYAVRPALEGDRSFQIQFMSELRRRRDLAVDYVTASGQLSCAIPEAAFYLMVKVDDTVEEGEGATDESFLLSLLEETGVLVVHGSGFGLPSSPIFFRLVFLANDQVLTRALDRISQFLALRSAAQLLRE